MPFKVLSVKSADKEIVGFVIAYLIPLANLGTDGIKPRVLMFVIALFFFMVLSTQSYHFNPLLSLMGYHFYEVTDDQRVSYILVTRRSLRDTRNVASVVQLSEYMMLDVRKP